MLSELYKRLKISRVEGKLLPKASPAAFAKFESSHGVRLPASYREYAKVFGAGEIAGYCRIAVPLGVKVNYDLENHNKKLHGKPSDELWGAYGPKQLIEKMIFFGSTLGGDAIAWDTGAVADADGPEYEICLFESDLTISRVSKSFSDFVWKHCVKQGKKPSKMIFLRY